MLKKSSLQKDMEDKIALIREKIIAANPEIMELKTGCRVKQILYRKKPIKDSNPIVLVHEDSHYSVEGDFLIEEVNSGEFSDYETPMKYFKILGRPIRLADVLLAMGRKADRINVGGDGAFNCLNQLLGNWSKRAFWNLRKDNLEDQSEECINFLYELLK